MAAEMPQMTERPRVVRTVPELATFSYTDQGRREYQQDAVYVTPSKKFAANRKTAHHSHADRIQTFGTLTESFGKYPLQFLKKGMIQVCLNYNIRENTKREQCWHHLTIPECQPLCRI